MKEATFVLVQEYMEISIFWEMTFSWDVRVHAIFFWNPHSFTQLFMFQNVIQFKHFDLPTVVTWSYFFFEVSEWNQKRSKEENHYIYQSCMEVHVLLPPTALIMYTALGFGCNCRETINLIRNTLRIWSHAVFLLKQKTKTILIFENYTNPMCDISGSKVSSN